MPFLNAGCPTCTEESLVFSSILENGINGKYYELSVLSNLDS